MQMHGPPDVAFFMVCLQLRVSLNRSSNFLRGIMLFSKHQLPQENVFEHQSCLGGSTRHTIQLGKHRFEPENLIYLLIYLFVCFSYLVRTVGLGQE